MVFLSVRTEKAIKKLTKVNQAVGKAGDATTKQLGEMGKQYARSIVPVYTGRTHDYIILRPKKTKDGTEQKVIARNPTASDGRQRNVANFNLVRWMHTSPRARGHIRSGDPQFMYTTRDYLNKIKKNVAKGRFKSINIK